MEMLPHEKALVQRLKSEPFVLIGINDDGTPEEVLPRLKQEGITWRNAIEPAEGALASSWDVTLYPDLYLLDGEGMIRAHWSGFVESSVLDRRIDELLLEMKANSVR